MATDNAERESAILYEPDERPPLRLELSLGVQKALIIVPSIVLTPAIVIRAAGGPEDFLGWAVFAAVVISGLTTVLQSCRIGQIGAGYPLSMGTSGAFIAICVAALSDGSPAMLATLVIVSSLFQFVFSSRLYLFRTVLTPTVTGTVVMLIAVTVMPIFFDLINDVPAGTDPVVTALISAVTLLAVVLVALKAKGALRIWALMIGIATGSVLAGYFGLYDVERVAEAAWIGLPPLAWPGVDLSFNATFWELLPPFVFVTIVGAIETIGDAVAIQRVSWRRPRAIDFRAVQGALAADGIGNLLSGLAGTVPNTTYSTSVSVIELTGVAARAQGVVLGVIVMVLAFSPKALALLLAIPNPVAGAYGVALLSVLFVLGMKLVVQDGADYRKSLIVGIAFWLGVGFEGDMIFPELTADFAGGLLRNGMTSGGLVAIVLTVFDELTKPRRRSIELDLTLASLSRIKEFLAGFTLRNGWDEAMADRLTAAAEETLLTLLNQDDEDGTDVQQKRLFLSAQKDNEGAKLEFLTTTSKENLQTQIALLSEQTDLARVERDVSLRLLNHVADSVHHQQYHDTDVITVRLRHQRVAKPKLWFRARRIGQDASTGTRRKNASP